MSCHTEPCSRVRVVVKRWMDSHPEVSGIWDVFDVQSGLDIVVSVHQSDAVRQLTLAGEQTEPTLRPVVERRILEWLENLSSQPVI